MRVPRRIKWRNGVAYYHRKVPRRFRDVDRRDKVEISLETGDERRAVRAAAEVEREVERYWLALKSGASEDARERYLAAIERARLEGFDYHPAPAIADGLLADIVARLRRLEELGALPAAAETPPDGGEATARALLGGAAQPRLSLSAAIEEYFRLTRDQVRRKSPGQLHRWQLPRRRAVANLVSLVGDKALADVTRSDALALHTFWMERILEGTHKPNTANKDVDHLSVMFAELDAKLALGLGRPFEKLRFDDSVKATRAPFSLAELRRIALDPAGLAELNKEARGVVLAMIETGMRPIEICALDPGDIALDAEVPHVLVRPKEDFELKVQYSERTIPLIGVSLQAFLANPGGFPRYRDKATALSNLVNDSLRARGLLPTERHSLYSIRHAFQDRILAANMPDRIQAELMGHKFDRPSYGAGPSLAHKREWLERIAITNGHGEDGGDAGQGALPL